MPEVLLPGCRLEPLASYLKALGVLRLVGAQVDAGTTGRWQNDRFVLGSPLDLDGLATFLADRYVPTPMIAPWNKGSGFGNPAESTSPTATEAVAAIASSADSRLAPIRQTIAAVDRLRARPDWYTLPKESQVALCRNHLPDVALEWLDATVVLTTDDRTFPPLLGTGGNDGRFDFGSNLLQRLAELFGVSRRARGSSSPVDLAIASLTGDRAVRADRVPIGQFDPAAAGGPSSSPYGAAEFLVNPWHFVLLLEGALYFASGASRRLSTGAASSAVPFAVGPSRAGHPSWSDAETSRGELWAPVWSGPATAAEIRHLMGEGRIEFRSKQASNGLDVVRAIASLGVDRRIDEFVRYAFVERNGLATFAVSLGRVKVRDQPSGRPLGQLDRWARPLRTAKAPPQGLPGLLHRLDDAQFAASTGGGAPTLQTVLFTLAELERSAQRSGGLRRVVGRAVSGLGAVQWLPLLDDGTPEMEIAASLASVRARGTNRSLLRGVFGDPEWRGHAPLVSGFHDRPLVDSLTAALVRLAIDAPRTTPELAPRWLGGPAALPCRLETVEAFIRGEVDDERVRLLLAGCLLLDWRGEIGRLSEQRDRSERQVPVRPAVAVLLPFFHRRVVKLPWQRSVEVSLVADQSWPRRLARGEVAVVVRDAWRRFRIAGLEPAGRDADRVSSGVEPTRLAAACLIPMSDWGIGALLGRSVIPPSERDEGDAIEPAAIDTDEPLNNAEEAPTS